MIKFDMQIVQNYAAFFDTENGTCVFVDSFDNHEFDVRIGSLKHSKCVGTVHATNDDELNARLSRLTAEHL